MYCDDKVQILSLMEIKGISHLDVLEVLDDFFFEKKYSMIIKFNFFSNH